MGLSTFTIAADIFARHPAYVRGVLVFEGLDNAADQLELGRLLHEAEVEARQRTPVNVTEMPEVAAWREAYRQFGAKPSEHRSAIEALLRRVCKPDSLPRINALVDIGNIVSLRHALPAGVHPLPAGAECTVALRLTRPGDSFLPADGAPPERLPAGEIVLAHGSDVLTRRWTWRQGATTRTLKDTKRVFFNVDGLPPANPDRVHAAMLEIKALVATFCGGRLVAEATLGSDRPQLVADSESKPR